jgi:hypothetical protein
VLIDVSKQGAVAAAYSVHLESRIGGVVLDDGKVAWVQICQTLLEEIDNFQIIVGHAVANENGALAVSQLPTSSACSRGVS